MTPTLYLAIAGIPPQIEDGFTSAFVKLVSGRDVRLISLLGLPLSEFYTEEYAEKLYNRFAQKLRQCEPRNRKNLLRNANLILLYLDKQDGSESALFDHFGIEALVLPLVLRKISGQLTTTNNQRNNMVNQLIKDVRRAMKHARNLFSVIIEEVTNRDNKTCLLLPPRTFGGSMQPVIDRVWEAGRKREDATRFKAGVKRVARSFPSMKADISRGGAGLYSKLPRRQARVMAWHLYGKMEITIRYASSVGDCGSARPMIRNSTTIAKFPQVSKEIFWAATNPPASQGLGAI